MCPRLAQSSGVLKLLQSSISLRCSWLNSMIFDGTQGRLAPQASSWISSIRRLLHSDTCPSFHLWSLWRL